MKNDIVREWKRYGIVSETTSPRSIGNGIPRIREFVQHYTKLAQSLNDLTRKEVEFVWENIKEDAYQKLTYKLSKGPIFQLYNPKAVTQEFGIKTMRSRFNMVLLQIALRTKKNTTDDTQTITWLIVKNLR
ncbi:hypothetical protein CBL_20006 [Carabus blaptoides fortunei]